MLLVAAEGLSFAEITSVCDDAIKDAILDAADRVDTAGLLKLVEERRIEHGRA